MNKCKIKEIYTADIGRIVKLKDSPTMYEAGKTLNGYCYKDYKAFKNEPDKICYIAECNFDDDLFLNYVNDNKDELLKLGGISTANSIKKEIRKYLEREEYFYEYEKNGVVYTIDAKNFDDEMICSFAEYVFDVIDWQCSSTFICENDWEEDINEYYSKKFKTKEISI